MEMEGTNDILENGMIKGVQMWNNTLKNEYHRKLNELKIEWYNNNDTDNLTAYELDKKINGDMELFKKISALANQYLIEFMMKSFGNNPDKQNDGGE